MNDKNIDATRPARPIPRQGVYVDTRPFWDGISQGRLVLQYCTAAGRFQHYPKPVSAYSGRRTLEWREVSGKGAIYAATVVRIAGPGVEGRIPLCVATVELDEGVRIIANVLNCAPADLAVGKRVRLAIDHLAPDHPYPAFELE
ncbi:Zn-ribbon domain-containing OB-fold protein [Achromobacter aloeverae]|uniref:DNA-binding protein n=1 Tax=Achromobacter aloeverae TaxID=1750518 RepID=A0A4Q1HMJ1_9BURK|nr:OB-fold domain-containing protein [Achromobacter aloeverae]RXN91731.1 DNA-binding protein [Achromobacter aloeverae]